MKTLYIMRHAKAATHNTAPTDFERHLTERGMTDASEMGSRLYAKNVKIDVIIGSPAARTKETADYVAKALKIKTKEIIYIEDIYEATPQTIARIVTELNDDYNSVLLVGHNPTFTYMMEYFSESRIDNLPTSGIYMLTFETNSWTEATQHKGILKWADWPKA